MQKENKTKPSNCKKLGDGFIQCAKKFNDPIFVNVYNYLSSFFIFTEDQFIDMFTCAVELNSVLTVDRNFNLGTYFLTYPLKEQSNC